MQLIKIGNDDLIKITLESGLIIGYPDFFSKCDEKDISMWFVLDPELHDNKIVNINGKITSVFSDVRSILRSRKVAEDLANLI